MSLQGPIIVVAETSATNLTRALSAAGAFPIVEARWADAPAALLAVKPAAMIFVGPDLPTDESTACSLSRQIAAAEGPFVPAIVCVRSDRGPAIPLALPADADFTVERLVKRLVWAQRVRAMHATVLRRIETFSGSGSLPALSADDPLEDATVLVVGRGPQYPALSVAVGEQVGVVGAFSVEAAAGHLSVRDVDGIVIGDGFSQRMVQAFLTVLAEEPRFRDLPVAVAADAPADFSQSLTNIEYLTDTSAQLVAHIMPLVRMHAFENRLKRILNSLEAEGMVDPQTGLLMHDAFWRDLNQAIMEASDRSQPLSVARFAFEGPLDERAGRDGARLVTKLIRNIDFATREDDGSILIAFTQTDLRSAHVVVRRLAGTLRNHMLAADRPQEKITANVTLATLKAGDNLDSLMTRVTGTQVVAAE